METKIFFKWGVPICNFFGPNSRMQKGSPCMHTGTPRMYVDVFFYHFLSHAWVSNEWAIFVFAFMHFLCVLCLYIQPCYCSHPPPPPSPPSCSWTSWRRYWDGVMQRCSWAWRCRCPPPAALHHPACTLFVPAAWTLSPRPTPIAGILPTSYKHTNNLSYQLYLLIVWHSFWRLVSNLVSGICPWETKHVELYTSLKGNSSQPHNFAARDPSHTILRCQNFVVCGEEYIIFVLLGYHRTYRDKGGAINWRIAHNSQIFVERNKSFQFL
jgi:hypothetical protein